VLSLLKSVPDELWVSSSERDKVRGVRAELKIQLGYIKRLKENEATLNSAEKEELENRKKKVTTIVYSTASYETLRNHSRTQKPESGDAEFAAQPTRGAFDVATEIPRASTPVQLDDIKEKAFMEAIRIARKRYPQASEIEVLVLADQYSSAASARDFRMNDMSARKDTGSSVAN
jgi:hypothetical protein